MCLIILRHCQNRDHCNTSVLASLASGSLIHGRKVCIHIARISTTSRNLFLRCRNLTKCVCVVCDICQDNQYMHIFLKCQIFCRSQRHTRCGNTLNRRVICQVNKQHGSINRSGLFEGLYEIVGLFKCNTHSGKYNREFFVCTAYLRLSCNLGCQLRMRQTGTGEDWQLLSTNQCIQSVNGRYSRLDKFLRIYSCCRIHRKTINISSFFR